LGSLRFRLLVAFAAFAGAAALALVTAEASLAAVIATGAIVSLGGVVLWLAADYVERSVRVIRGAAREMAQGEFGTRLPTEDAGELAGAFQDFNEMASSFEDRVEAASQERNRLMAAINSSVDAVVALGEDGVVRFANAAAETLVGKGEGGLVGRPLAWAVADRDVIDAVRRAGEEGAVSRHLIERPNRQILEAYVAPITGGGEWTLLVVFHDVTEPKRLDDVRRDFVANVSHELRTPLSAIKSVIETLQSGAVDEPAVARDFLARAETEVERLVQLLEELLALSRLESGDLRFTEHPLDMRDVVRSVGQRMAPYARRAGVELRVDADGRTQRVSGDPAALERAIVNLVDNAIKFTSEGGSVDLSSRAEDGSVTIVVADTGSGIDPLDLPRIFERFFKADRARQRGGTGLGLAIVKHTVEAHGGSIGVDSQLGAGSVFRLSLPLVSAADSG